MKKKHVLKILSASAVAASALVVAPSIEAASINEVEKLVKTAKDAGTVLKWAISIEGTADGQSRPWVAYNNAKSAYDKAFKAINTLTASQKSRYLVDLDENVKLHINRTMHYIDAITAGEKIREKQEALAYYVSMNIINDNTEKAFHELSTEIRKQAILLDRVYGQSTRDLIRSHYKGAAEKVRNSAKYPVTVKIELDLATIAIAAKNSVQAEKHLAEARKYLSYVDNPVMKRTLTDRLNSIDMNFTPKVEKVSAAEPKRIKVEFNKAMLSGIGTNGAENISNYSVSGRSIKSVKLSVDRKTAVIDLYDSLNTNSTYTIIVKKNIQTASFETLGSSDYSTYFTFTDNTKPTVTSILSNTNGTIEIKFSELIDRNSTLSIIIDGESVTSIKPNDDTDTIIIAKTELDKLGLRKGKSYSITLSGAKDLVDYNPNIMNSYRGTFVYNPAADTVLPVVQSVVPKDEKTLTIQFSETLADFTINNLVITKGSTTIRPTSVKDISNGSKNKFDIELPTSIYGTNETAVSFNVQVKNYKDLGENTGQTINRTATLTKDTTPPRFVSINYDINKKEIQLTFNELLNTGLPVTSKITVYDKDNKPIKLVFLKSNVDNKLIINAKDIPDGAYTIVVDEGAVKDRSISQNPNSSVTTSIIKKDDIVKPTVTFLETGNNGQFNAVFSEAVTTESATLVSNYLIDGSNLPSGTTFTMSTDQRVVTLNLPEGTIDTTKRFTISAKGIKDLSDNIMNPFAASITLRENTQPLLIHAVKSVNNILLTFSENITLIDNGQTSFDIIVDGAKLSVGQYHVSMGSKLNELIVTSASDILFSSASDITIVTSSSPNIYDSAENRLKAGIEVRIKN